MSLSAAVLAALINQCAPNVSPDTMNALIMTESGANPYVIANVSDGVSKYFKDEKGAIEYAEKLTTENKNFSAGLTQIYSKNFPSLNLTYKTVFDPCTNIKAGAAVLTDNYLKQKEGTDYQKILRALSLYYSGNELTGFKKEKKFNNTSYLERITRNANSYIVPSIRNKTDESEIAPPNDEKKTSPEWDVFGDFN
ncbi:lytic transglycosylase domain-containing protein [Escherichia coli]|uniref:lytic transglycosylase domain-containing protein n=1 Tax=Escherichia coli TaxID=562 RepID=UPI001371F0EE|nr:lytic transglycosylase domain-containing protein [Escherichia coli]ELH6552589.1 lytic transglycosylase domain-containing protein [Escherichia coli]ELH6581083.1 lytic transglycosylase domain-containing protein [Escherichia coli]ELH6613842.1 lytic transglycosylase domain-containing protein [Escherichia coli]ELH6628413.1 lytic transglycosylase domain-containing protein [Escherichia coli]ELH6660678.1 lytic transglycosylase domain-containing protein [Escherichia coli]